jgi:putative ABC transport system permease protein
MNSLDRKMLRDLSGMRGQAIAIAFVILAGVSTYVTMSATMGSLKQSLDTYYTEYRFADAFATLRRAPERVAEDIRKIPGVNAVETRVVAFVNLEIEGFDEPVSGQIVSIPEGRQPALNRLFIRKGRVVRAGYEEEVILNEVFAEAHGLDLNDRFTAVINGRRKTLRVVGIALSPEFLMQVQPGSIFPDPRLFGVIWMGREALSAAFDMKGAFNDVVLSLAPGAVLEDVLDRMDVLLERYGSRDAYGRKDQASHFYIMEEFRGLESMATMLPIIFLAVAAFLLNIVVTRLISTQREQVAVLKAFGYTDNAVGWHYIKLVLVIAFFGVVAGVLVGIWLGTEMGELYMIYYRFPYLDFELRVQTVLFAALLTIGAALVGVVRAVRRAVSVPPAEAMRPSPPAAYRPTVIERLGLKNLFDQPTRMIARNLERRPFKALLTVVGIAFSCAIMIVGSFSSGAISQIIDMTRQMQREDLTVNFVEPTSTAALYELKAMQGVWHAEPFRTIPVRLVSEHRSHSTAIEGIDPNSYLRRLVDAEQRPVQIPPDGLVLNDRLAGILGVGVGDVLTVEVLEGKRWTRRVPVAALTTQFLGLSVYMNMEAANRMAGSGQTISGVYLATDSRYEADVVHKLKELPRVSGVASPNAAMQAFLDTSAETILAMTFILTLFAGAIAFGVIYNSVRISLSERDRELASLRVLGFTRGEISYILLGEQAFLTLLALPLGFVLGTLGVVGVAEGTQTDLYRLPPVVDSSALALAAVAVLGASLISALIVRYRLDRLDLVGVLKTRE